MSTHEPGHEPAPEGRADALVNERVDALASTSRRRLLLKGIGKAGAVAGAAIPLRGLATGEKNLRISKSGKNYRCTVSAQASLLHSATAALPPVCSGNPITYYCTDSNWPQYNGKPVCQVGATRYLQTATLDNVMGFNGGVTNSDKTLKVLVNNYGSTDAACWVVALLNAEKCSSTFPYTTSEVQSLYVDATKRNAAATFFRSYLTGIPTA